jgi:exodeoxyribonuclease VII large subunit
MSSFFDFQKELTERKAAAKAPRKPANAPADGRPEPLTISQLTAQIDRAIKGAFPSSVLVRGEVSNLKIYGGSGHCYLTLKDSDACINCVMFKSDFTRVKFELQDGMEVLASGRLGVYGARGAYQLYLTRLEPLGQGALELAFRQLCAKLEAEGLFAPERKKPIPAYPLRIALVTSRQTAALQDMLKVLRRYPFLTLMLYHVPVQGEGAAEQIATALRDLSAHAGTGAGTSAGDIGGLDVILLARGGGSLEDLWQFNEEVVARAIAASTIPVITGIGHEVDVSVADLVADHHAHTPTEAAQVAVAHWRTASDELLTFAGRLHRGIETTLDSARDALSSIQRHEFFRRPTDRLNQHRQRLDELESRLQGALRARLGRQQHRLHDLAVRLAECSPRHLLARKLRPLLELEKRLERQHPHQLVRLASQQVTGLNVRLELALKAQLDRHRERVEQFERHLKAIGPMEVLARGYSITTLKKTGAIVRAKGDVAPGDQLLTRLVDSQIDSTVNGIAPAPAPVPAPAPARRRKPEPPDPNQGRLF